MLVHHPAEDGRLGAFISFDEVARATGWPWTEGLARVTFPAGWAMDNPREIRDGALLQAQEFDPSRPFEAIRLDTHLGYGFFYLPAEPA